MPQFPKWKDGIIVLVNSARGSIPADRQCQVSADSGSRSLNAFAVLFQFPVNAACLVEKIQIPGECSDWELGFSFPVHFPGGWFATAL